MISSLHRRHRTIEFRTLLAKIDAAGPPSRHYQDARILTIGEGTSVIEAHVTEILARQDQTMTMLLEMRALGDDRRKDVLEMRDSYETLAQDVIREAQTDGVLRSDMDASDLALATLNLVNSPVVWFRPTGPRSAADLGRQYADLFIEGSRSRK